MSGRICIFPESSMNSLIGEVNGNRRLQIDIALAPAVERMQALNSKSLLGLRDRKKNFGIFIGILYTHAAVTISADGLAKQIFVRRIVLINQELIWKIEAHAPKCITVARWLIYSDRAVAVAANSQSDPRERGWISGESRKIFVSDSRRWYIPRRIERDVLYRLCQQGSCVLPGLTDNNARRPYR